MEPPVERRREATGQHNNQQNKGGAMEQKEAGAPAEGFGELERAADKRGGQQERQQRFIVVVRLIVFGLHAGELLHFCGRGKKGTSFCRNIVPTKRNSWKVTLGKKGTWKGIPFFCRNLEVIPQDSWNWKAKKKEHKKEYTT